MSKAKDINPLEVERLASVGCKTSEIAKLMGCSPDTIERNFAAFLTKGRENLKVSLRQWQLQAAKKGNVVMLIWLGKQYLEQSDKVVSMDSLPQSNSIKLSNESIIEILNSSRKKNGSEESK